MDKEQKHLFEDGEEVRIKETGEVVTVDYWWYLTSSIPSEVRYSIDGIPDKWFHENELEKKESH